MKAILMSIKPKWVAKILNKEKTIEIRKTTPKCDLPIDVYIYCTKENKKNWHLIEVIDTDTGCEGYEYDYYIGSKGYLSHCLEGKVVAKFTLKEIRLAKYQPYVNEASKMANKLTYLTDEELDKYLNKKDGFGWVIDDLEIFDEPKELGEFYKCEYIEDTNISNKERHFRPYIKITKAPQSYMFIEVDDEETKISLDENKLEWKKKLLGGN